MDRWWFLPAAVGSAFAFGTSTHLKHRSATDVPAAHMLQLGAIGRLVRASVAHRLWITGICADAVGLALQVLALHLGPLSAVQPVLVLSLLIALLLHQRLQGGTSAAEIWWAVLLTVTLAGLIAITGAAGGPRISADPGPALTATGIGVALTVCCLLLSRSTEGSRRAAALLGIAVGGIYATTAALIKVTTNIGARDPVSVLWHWQFYAALSLGAVGLVLSQLAFRAGPLAASLPAMSVVDPLISIAIGIWVFDEHVRHGAGADIALVVALFALTVSAIKLARIASPTGKRADHYERRSGIPSV